MTWRGWLAIVAVLLVAFLVFTYMTRQRWVEKDVERQMQIAQLQREAEQHGQAAAAANKRKIDAIQKANEAAAARDLAKAELDTLRKAYAATKRTEARTAAEWEQQAVAGDRLIVKLEEDLQLADATIIALNHALTASNGEASSLRDQVTANEEAWELERKRSESWQQQTKRGRVKTAFLTIGATAAGGLAGYGIGATAR